MLGWSGDGEDTLWIPVREGYINVAHLVCPLPPRVELAVFAHDAPRGFSHHYGATARRGRGV